MSITGDLGQDTLDLRASGQDTVVIGFTSRVAIYDVSLHNQGSVDVETWFYASPDFTSASGKRVAVTFLATNDVRSSYQIPELRQGYSANENIIAVIKTPGIAEGDVNIKLTYTEYTGSS